MLEFGLNAPDFCVRVVQPVIDDDGAECRRIVVFYSGPSRDILKRLRRKVRENWKRAADEATRHGASRIDNTKAFALLNAANLKTYFVGFYGAGSDDIPLAELQVWGFTSERFASGKFEEVVTVVCGADPERAFRAYEQAAILRNPHVKIANKRDIQLFRDFDAIDPYEAFRLFCVTELLELRKYAQKKGTKKAWREYRMRRRFFLEERRDTLKAMLGMSPEAKAEIKRQKHNVLVCHRIQAIETALLSATPSVPQHTTTTLATTHCGCH